MSLHASSIHELVASLGSVERLDVLLHLRGLEGRTVTAVSVAARFRISGLAAEQHLASLCGRELVEKLEQEVGKRRSEIVARFRQSSRHVLIADDDSS